MTINRDKYHKICKILELRLQNLLTKGSIKVPSWLEKRLNGTISETTESGNINLDAHLNLYALGEIKEIVDSCDDKIIKKIYNLCDKYGDRLLNERFGEIEGLASEIVYGLRLNDLRRVEIENMRLIG